MNRAEITALLSGLLERDVLSGGHWASEVKYLKSDGSIGRVDYMSFEPRTQTYGPTASAIEGGQFTCYEVKSCMADYTSGHGLNFIGERNAMVMPMGLYKQLPQRDTMDVSVYVPIPFYLGNVTNEMRWAEFDEPHELTPSKREWRLAKMTDQPIIGNRRHSTCELLFAMLKAGR